MLKGIDPRISPDVLHVLAMMGHGDEIALVDTNFPAHTFGAQTVYGHVLSIGTNLPEAVSAVLSLLPLDKLVASAGTTMEVVGSPDEIPPAVAEITAMIRAEGVGTDSIERFAFYERARECFAILQTREPRVYGNVILKKGVIAG